MVEYQEVLNMHLEQCCNCGMSFGLPVDYRKRRINDHQTFYCPNGHGQSYKGESEAERLKRQLEWEQGRVKRLENSLEIEQRSVSAYKGQVTKLKKRAAAGICPCCNRQFTNMASHMKTKHPNFIQQEEGEVRISTVEHLNPHKCKIFGCKESVKSKEMCQKHYMADYHKRKKSYVSTP